MVVAGEASADLHGSKIVARLRELAPSLLVYGLGGDRMKAQGAELVFHCEDFAMVGLVEVLAHVPRLLRAMDALVGLATERDTKLAILIDYPGFNLALAKRLQRAGVRVLYYISPQVWAWGEWRVGKIAARVDRMAVILPFEQQFYRERGVDVEFVGHPLLEEPALTAVGEPRRSLPDPALVGLLPGSRRQEIARHLPPMLGAVRLLRERLGRVEIKLGLAEGVPAGVLPAIERVAAEDVDVVPHDRVYDLMRSASVLLVSSGTATLEAACLGAPMVIIYKMAPLSMALGRLLVRIPHVGLVNVVAGTEVVPELIQGSVTPERLATAAEPFLVDRDLVERTSALLLDVRSRLGSPGASDRVARMALAMMSEAE